MVVFGRRLRARHHRLLGLSSAIRSFHPAHALGTDDLSDATDVCQQHVLHSAGATREY